MQLTATPAGNKVAHQLVPCKLHHLSLKVLESILKSYLAAHIFYAHLSRYAITSKYPIIKSPYIHKTQKVARIIITKIKLNCRSSLTWKMGNAFSLSNKKRRSLSSDRTRNGGGGSSFRSVSSRSIVISEAPSVQKKSSFSSWKASSKSFSYKKSNKYAFIPDNFSTLEQVLY